MKSGIFLSIILFVIITAGCTSEEKITEPEAVKSGRLKISFDKILDMTELEEISLLLTRIGHETISKTIKTNETSSIFLFDKVIEPGIWHVKIGIKLSSASSSYEEDINVLPNFVTAAALTKGNSGMFKFEYAWNKQIEFHDFGINPVFTRNNSVNSPGLGVASSFILYEENKYKMWYANMYPDRKYDINYAESGDGINWQSKSQSAVISPGTGNAWDSYAVYPGAVIKEGSLYKMYYVGVTGYSSDSYVGLATSADGINWSKHPEPVIAFPFRRMAVNTVLKYAGNYMLYYNFTDLRSGETGIGLITSADGLVWSNAKDHIITIGQQWETNYLISPCVRLENGIFIMYYGTLVNNAFGIAASTDGINWKKSTNNPIFTKEKTEWAEQVRYPFVIKINDVFRLYYTGYRNGFLSIAFAEGLNL